MSGLQSLANVTIVCRNAVRLAEFYVAALGFERFDQDCLTDPALGRLLAMTRASAQVVRLRLGAQALILAGISPPGRPYPADTASNSLLFQHFAMSVPDMARACDRLATHSEWTSISIGGPQRLPASSGGAIAFKFRDPEGHPLELIQLADANVGVGINHSAISIHDTERSIAFYARLGLRRTGGTLNQGPEQDRLDGLTAVRVEVTALTPQRDSIPHLELLCYRDVARCDRALPAPNDAAATQLVYCVESGAALSAICQEHATSIVSGPVRFEDGLQRALLRDPDGHLLCLEAKGG